MVLVAGVMRIWPPPFPYGCDTLMGAGTVLTRECLAPPAWKPVREPLQPSPFMGSALGGGLRRPLEASKEAMVYRAVSWGSCVVVVAGGKVQSSQLMKVAATTLVRKAMPRKEPGGVWTVRLRLQEPLTMSSCVLNCGEKQCPT